ncbi:MAG: hypothetical protein CL557_12775 [Alphaproteobacteria bacterium]|jgi:hypothetical protein|nr:hypothetical protein [Alphaproteobacteria bacterium]MBN59141.1 hypothetical protein [Oceanospirillaceae bacterium]MAJ64482.1 hypothetical protein [Alphaproteobacteria bacterium]MAJ64514.1 hypothetical protein [Alphaproteobacteria bacterium]MAS48268.1 hypothetical protein [Alphaproteobacteria bacterium]|tara:strand:- start:2211 stop:2411 length:201 start_codon:yes stop_codon:yes gene_type:complete
MTRQHIIDGVIIAVLLVGIGAFHDKAVTSAGIVVTTLGRKIDDAERFRPVLYNRLDRPAGTLGIRG